MPAAPGRHHLHDDRSLFCQFFGTERFDSLCRVDHHPMHRDLNACQASNEAQTSRTQ
jgi:hypothetical protein